MMRFLCLARKRLLAEIETERQGLRRVRPLMKSTTIGRDGMRMVVGSGGGGTKAGTRHWLPLRTLII